MSHTEHEKLLTEFKARLPKDWETIQQRGGEDVELSVLLNLAEAAEQVIPSEDPQTIAWGLATVQFFREAPPQVAPQLRSIVETTALLKLSTPPSEARGRILCLLQELPPRPTWESFRALCYWLDYNEDDYRQVQKEAAQNLQAALAAEKVAA